MGKGMFEYLVGKNDVAPDLRYRDFNSLLLPPDHVKEADVVIVGVPYDPGTPKHVGASQGPMGIRNVLSFLRTFSCELGIDIIDYLKIVDVGNVDISWNDWRTTYARIDAVLSAVLEMGKTPIILGGDHSITTQNFKTFCESTDKQVGLIWFDNHLDTMKDYHGDNLYCGCPLYNMLAGQRKWLNPSNVVCIGSRGFHHSPQMWQNARDFGINIFRAEDVRKKGIDVVVDEAIELAKKNTDRLYISFDIDVADAAFAPGTQSPCPGGLSPLELQYAVRTIASRGADCIDIVEVAPPKDIGERTAFLAASIALEFMAGLAWRKASA